MSENRETITRQAHLRVAFIFFTFWLFILYVIFTNIRDLGGLAGFEDVIKNGDYSDLLLFAFSIFLLAMFIRSMFKYFLFKDDTSKS